MTTSNWFAPGHRIRIEVSSSNFPRFDRNLNTGGNKLRRDDRPRGEEHDSSLEAVSVRNQGHGGQEDSGGGLIRPLSGIATPTLKNKETQIAADRPLARAGAD
jgi:hypothetical protein